MSSRKRAAPGANPANAAAASQQRMQQNYISDNSAVDAMGRWNATGGDDPANFLDDNNFYPLMQQQHQQPYVQPMATPSNTLTRRQMNNALVPTRQTFEAPTDPWSGFDVDSALVAQPAPVAADEAPEPDSIEKLEEMAQKAKKEAQTKRKSIPPFVQKLSSFLEERKNEDLIRWSEKGDSFIVLDEDEFAKTLIPELFKHNKYASFVRQLNMYGFHKCVGLSDNSMRASERKNKSPSEYANPYFRRGHPNLLWLINKPKSDPKPGTGKAAKAADAGDSDDDGVNDDGTANHSAAVGALPPSRALPSPEGAPIQKKEIGVIREELRKVREQQKLILGAINRIQQNNNDLYNQAMMFQNQHDRHQNSINAILNFLANVFRKTLEDQSSNQNVNDIISSLMSNQGQAGGHGSVVDLGDFFQSQMDHSGAMGGGPPKRARGLLPPIPGQATTQPSSRTTSVSTPFQGSHAQMGHVTELNEASPSESPSLRQELESNPQERMMKIINDHNNANSSSMDLPKVEELVANTPNTLSNDQRSQLVNFMAGQANSPSSSTGATPSTAQTRSRTSASAQSAPAPKVSTDSTSSAAAPSLSPIMRSPQMAVPSLSQISANQEELARLQQLQSEQDAKINELGSLLGPLSPSGRIPGLDDPDTYFNNSGVDDFDQLFNSDAFANDPAFLNTDDFSFPGDADDKQQQQQDKDTPGSTGTEEIQRDDLATDDAMGPETRGTKRQRTT